ncbi:MAG: response regulator [Phycisphaerales bacterium]
MSDPRLQDYHILIVDDDEDILGSIDLAVRSEGADTTLVTDGASAVSMAHSVQPDAVVLDMMLPKQSGFLVLEKLMDGDDPPIVVMITANQGRRHMEYAKDLGVAAYLNKPVALQRLIDTLSDLLEAADADYEDEDEAEADSGD